MSREFPTRRTLLRTLGSVAAALPFLLDPRRAHGADGHARRALFFYFPDGIPGTSADGDASEWHCTGTEHDFRPGRVLEPLGELARECLFFNGLSMGATDSGSHPGGAVKLLTASDHGMGESIDQYLARTVGAAAPFRHVYLGAMANVSNASGDKHISYPAAGQSVAPEDDPVRAFERLFGAGAARPPAPGSMGPAPPAVPRDRRKSVLDVALADLNDLRGQVGRAERARLDLHAESIRELERRIDALAGEGSEMGAGGASGASPADCESPTFDAGDLNPGVLYSPERFPEILALQTQTLVQAMACGLTQVGVIQCSVHTSELIMSRFPGTEMFDAGFDMRSHQASHYGASHDEQHREYRDYVLQRKFFVARFAALLSALQSTPEGDGDMLDHSVVFCGSEVSDGNTHLHDDMPLLLAGRAGGAINPGRLLSFGYERHSNLFISMARAMGDGLAAFGDQSSGPLRGVLT